MSGARRVWVEKRDGRVVVHVATGPREWRFQLEARDAEALERELVAARLGTESVATLAPGPRVGRRRRP